MSLITPTTQDINDNIIAQLQTSLNQTIPLLPKSFLRVLAKTLSGLFILLYKYGGFMWLQIFVKTASDQDTEVNGVIINPLKFWGRLIGVGDPTPATSAELSIDVIVTNQTGILPSGTQLINSDNGVTYITIGAMSLDSDTVQTTIRAVSDQADGAGKGVIGNLEIGDIVSFANPLANINRTSIVIEQINTGADAEDTEVYRQRIQDRFQKPLQGGAYADYESWGEETAGIINVYPYTGSPGQVDVYSEATIESSGSVDGIPTEIQLEAVLDMINLDAANLATRRNTGAFVNSYPITRTSFDVRVDGIVGISSLAIVKLDIEESLINYFLSNEPFIPGLSIPPRVDQITATRISGIVEDIVTADGGTFTSATFELINGDSIIIPYILNRGEKSKLNSVIFS